MYGLGVVSGAFSLLLIGAIHIHNEGKLPDLSDSELVLYGDK